jgi:hypothetical protein
MVLKLDELVSNEGLEQIWEGDKRVVFQVWKSVLKIPLSGQHEFENKLEIQADDSDAIKNHSPKTVTFESLGISSIDDLRNLSSGDFQDSFLSDILESQNEIIQYLENNKKLNINIWKINIQKAIVGPSDNLIVRNLETGEVTTGDHIMSLQREKWKHTFGFQDEYDANVKKIDRDIMVWVLSESIEEVCKKTLIPSPGFKKHEIQYILEGNIWNIKNLVDWNFEALQVVTYVNNLDLDIKNADIVLKNFKKLCQWSSYDEIVDKVIKKAKATMAEINISHVFYLHTNIWYNIYWNPELFDKAVPKHEYILSRTWETYWGHLQSIPSNKLKYEILSKKEWLNIQEKGKKLSYVVSYKVNDSKSKSEKILNHKKKYSDNIHKEKLFKVNTK